MEGIKLSQIKSLYFYFKGIKEEERKDGAGGKKSRAKWRQDVESDKDTKSFIYSV